MRKEKTAPFSSEEQESVEAETKRTEGLQELQHQIGRLLWINLQGHILSAEDGRIGEQLTFCCCGDTMIGADLLEGQWRLWHWIPAAGTGIHIGTSFPADVMKVSILAEGPHAGENGRSFWCLEQYQQGLRVVQRDCEQGNERAAIWCEGFTLLCDWTGIRMEKCQGVVLSEGRLVLLGRDQDEKIKLVCIQ